MTTYMHHGLGSNAVGPNKEQLPLFQGFLSSATASRAKTPATRVQLRIPDQEFSLAVLTDLQGRPVTYPTRRDDEEFTSSDCVTSPRVAGLATRHEVVGSVVELVVVQVINDQVISAGRLANPPGDWLRAPMALVHPWADEVVEHFAVLKNLAMLRCQWVASLSTKHAVPGFIHALS